MTDEEYERLKEDEKAHLRKMQELKKAARQLERAKKIESAAANVDRAQDKLDESSALARVLNESAARSEARLDLALDADDSDAAAEDDPKARAQALVRRLRAEMQAEDASSDAPPASDDERTKRDGPDKTIGPAS